MKTQTETEPLPDHGLYSLEAVIPPSPEEPGDGTEGANDDPWEIRPIGGPWPSAFIDPNGHVQRLLLTAARAEPWLADHREESEPWDICDKFYDLLGVLLTAYMQAAPEHRDRHCVRDSGEFDLTRVPTLVLLLTVAMLTELECATLATAMLREDRGPANEADDLVLVTVLTLAGMSDSDRDRLMAEGQGEPVVDVGLEPEPRWELQATLSHRVFVRAVREAVGTDLAWLQDQPLRGLRLPPPWPDFKDGSPTPGSAPLHRGPRWPGSSIN